jgi:hypothetical protein
VIYCTGITCSFCWSDPLHILVGQNLGFGGIRTVINIYKVRV